MSKRKIVEYLWVKPEVPARSCTGRPETDEKTRALLVEKELPFSADLTPSTLWSVLGVVIHFLGWWCHFREHL